MSARFMVKQKGGNFIYINKKISSVLNVFQQRSNWSYKQYGSQYDYLEKS